jgi:hypothetical protein
MKLTELILPGNSFPYNVRDFFKYLPKFLKCCWQRITTGLCDYDVWNFDDHLSEIIANGCKKLRDRGISYPGGSQVGGATPEEWAQTLTQIIEGFEAWQLIGVGMLKVGDNWIGLTPKQYREKKKIFNKGFRLFRKYYSHLWD